LLLATLASVYGIIGGVFVDSPRRLRWDQRQRPRAGTPVPRVSETTRGVVAAVPRSLPRRAPPPPPSGSDLATRIEQSTLPGPGPSGDVATPHIDADLAATVAIDIVADGERPAPRDGADDESAVTDAADDRPAMPTQRLSGIAAPPVSHRRDIDEDETGGIVLPTSVEPKAQRSPWAWAAPPDWNRDDDDEGGVASPPRRP
jgi:hypothetical protein